jgi:hypothetical protein
LSLEIPPEPVSAKVHIFPIDHNRKRRYGIEDCSRFLQTETGLAHRSLAPETPV